MSKMTGIVNWWLREGEYLLVLKMIGERIYACVVGGKGFSEGG